MQVRPLVARIVSSRYVCATLDWWPSAKCDYKRCPWRGASMLEANLDDPLLRSAAKLLAPFYLRLGGSLSDQIVYEESTAAEGAAGDGAGHCPAEGAGAGDPTLDGFAKDDGKDITLKHMKAFAATNGTFTVLANPATGQKNRPEWVAGLKKVLYIYIYKCATRGGTL